MKQLEIRVAGGVTYWSASSTSRSRLYAELDRLGLATCMPGQRTQRACLEAALKTYAEPINRSLKRQHRQLVIVPHADPDINGFEVTECEAGKDHNAYTKNFSAKVVNGQVTTWGGLPPGVDLQGLFEQQRDLLPGTSVGAAMVAVVKSLGATSLRDSGGFYWLADERLEAWEQASEAFQRSCTEYPGTKVYLVRTAMDESTVAAVAEAVERELEQGYEELLNAIHRSPTENRKILNGRAQKALALQKRQREYEDYLSVKLERAARLEELVDRLVPKALLATF